MPYYVYILAGTRYGTLYIGITNDLRTRLEQHSLGSVLNSSANIASIASSTSRLMRTRRTLFVAKSN
jgi:hypothetical protein